MDIGLGIAFGSLVLGFLGFVYKVACDEEKKRERIFARMDEIKLNIKEDYVTKEVCNIMHRQIASDLSEVKKDVKTLLTRLTNNQDNSN